MKKIIGYSIIFLFLVSSCRKQKDLPVPEITEPHFYLNCYVDATPLNMQAGNEDYFMNSSWFHLDSPGVYVYKGNIAKEIGAGYQVTILINDYKITPANGAMNPDSALRKGQHLFYDQNTSGLTQEISFTPARSYVGNGESYSWSITDGVNLTTGTPYSISKTCNVGKTYSVTLNYDDGLGNCFQKHTNVFKAGSNLQTSIRASRDMSAYPEFKYNFSYSLPTNSTAMYKCLWQFADNMSFTTATVADKAFVPGTTSLIKLTLTDQNTNESCVSFYQLNAVNGSSCDANFTANFLPVQNSRVYTSVIVLLTDPQGVVYTSQGLVQPASSNFEILSVEEYTANDKGQPTKRLTAKFNCVVKNGTKEINLTGGDAKIAVAYK